MTVSLFSTPKPQFHVSGVPASGYKLFAYQAGTSTKEDTFTTQAGDVANANPIVLDSDGYPTSSIYMTDGTAYKFVLAAPADSDPPASPVWTEDNVYSNDSLKADLSSTASGKGSYLVALARRVVNLSDKGAVLDGTTDDTAAFNLAKALAETYNVPLCIDGTCRVTSEVNFDSDIHIIGTSPSPYDNAVGSWIYVDVDDVTKAGFYYGKTTSTIKVTIEDVGFKSLSANYACQRVECATFYSNNTPSYGNSLGNGMYVSDSYIGKVSNFEGTGKDYVLKITGNTSLNFDTLNIGVASAGTPSLQVIDMTDGALTFNKLYLEAQSTSPNMFIENCNEKSNITIRNVYEENSTTYGIKIDNSEAVLIDGYRTNAATEAIQVISGSKNIRINNLMGVDKFEKNELVNIESDCSVYISGVLYSRDAGAADGRQYALIRGEISGQSEESMSCNPWLQPSANNNFWGNGGAISATVPTGSLSGNSISLTTGQDLIMPLVKYPSGKNAVIKLVYQSSEASETAFQISINDGTTGQISKYESFHVSSASFQTLYFIVTLPENTSLDQYIEMHFEATGTALVHYFGIAEYGGGSLPSRMESYADRFEAEIDLSSAALKHMFGSTIDRYKIERYEMEYVTTSTGTPDVNVGPINNTPTLVTYGTFTGSAQSAGISEDTFATPTTSLYDHQNRETNGYGCQGDGTGTGTARVIVYARKADYNTY